jgi:hypothetical protein
VGGGVVGFSFASGNAEVTLPLLVLRPKCSRLFFFRDQNPTRRFAFTGIDASLESVRF